MFCIVFLSCFLFLSGVGGGGSGGLTCCLAPVISKILRGTGTERLYSTIARPEQYLQYICKTAVSI